MLHDSPKVVGKATGFVIDNGPAFPVTPKPNMVFILTATVGENGPGMYQYVNGQWLTGDISSVQAGSGLTGGGLAGSVSLSVDFTSVASRTFVEETVAGAASNVEAGFGISKTGDTLAAASSITPYDIAGSVVGKPTASAIVCKIPCVRAFKLPAALTGSIGVAGTAATASSVFSIMKNGVQFGTMTFGAGSANGVFASATGAVFAAGDVLSISAPASADGTLSDIAFTLSGNLQ